MPGLPAAPDYAGDLDCLSAFERLKAEPAAQLIDVRTQAEWSFTGVPDLASLRKTVLFVEWQSFPEGTPNARFVDEVDAALDQASVPPGASLIVLCRSGGRSAAAAAALTSAGFEPAFNILDGFEGGLDEHRHRGTRGGWKAAGLPWLQN